MSYSAGDARRQLLDDLAEVVDAIGRAIAALGDAYEQLDERSAERLEDELFRPVQAAAARAKRTHSEFAARHGLPTRGFAVTAGPGAPSRGVKGFLEIALEAVAQAEHDLAEMQDSMMPVEVGDAELRAGLAEVRELVGTVAARGREFVRLFGR